MTNGGPCALHHGIQISQWKPIWLATQLYPQNDWTGGKNEQWRICTDPMATTQVSLLLCVVLKKRHGAVTICMKLADAHTVWFSTDKNQLTDKRTPSNLQWQTSVNIVPLGTEAALTPSPFSRTLASVLHLAPSCSPNFQHITTLSPFVRFCSESILCPSVIILIPKTIGNRKRDCAWGGSGRLTLPEKIYRSQSTNQSAKLNERLPDLCFAICRFSQVRLISPSHLTHYLFFYFQ